MSENGGGKKLVGIGAIGAAIVAAIIKMSEHAPQKIAEVVEHGAGRSAEKVIEREIERGAGRVLARGVIRDVEKTAPLLRDVEKTAPLAHIPPVSSIEKISARAVIALNKSASVGKKINRLKIRIPPSAVGQYARLLQRWRENNDKIKQKVDYLNNPALSVDDRHQIEEDIEMLIDENDLIEAQVDQLAQIYG